MLKRISVAYALAVFVAVAGIFLVIANTEPRDVRNLDKQKSSISPLASAGPTVSAPVAVSSVSSKADNRIAQSAQNNMFTDNSGKDAIDLGEFVIHAR